MPSAERSLFRTSHPTRRVTISGTRWEYWAGGRGPGALLVLGNLLSFGDFAHPLVTAFEGTHRVLAPSYPALTDPDAVVKGLAEIITLERLEHVDVIGQGLGGGIAHLLARRYPALVRRLVLSGYGLKNQFRGAAQRTLVQMFEAMPHLNVSTHCLRQFERVAEKGERNRADEVIALANDLLERHTRESALLQLRLQAELASPAGCRFASESSTTPVMLLLANDDPFYTRQEQENLERAYQYKTVVRHLNAGRMLVSSAPQDMVRKLELYLAPASRAVAARIVPAAPTAEAPAERKALRPVGHRADEGWLG